MDVLGIYEQYENTADSVFQITLKSGRVITIHPKDDIWAWGGQDGTLAVRNVTGEKSESEIYFNVSDVETIDIIIPKHQFREQ